MFAKVVLRYARKNLARRFPSIGLMLVLGMLAHDIAMASDVHAGEPRATLEHSGIARHHHLVDHSHQSGAPGGKATAFSPSHPSSADVFGGPDHMGGCDVAPAVATPAERARRQSEPTTRLSWDAFAPLGGLAPGATAFAEPTRSPTVRRALVQVYRI